MAGKTRHPVVLRMAGLWPKDLGGYEGHRTRRGGDLGHVDKSRSGLNRRHIGSEAWARAVQDEVRDMAMTNHAIELEALRKRRRKAELLKRIAEGPRDPWRATRHGPMREIILTAHRDWFEGFDSNSMDDLFGDSREERFEALALSWLEAHFGEDLVHARADRDETTYHIHAVILPRAVTRDGRRMLQPSKHAMIADYEAAQDSVGNWFREIGLTRGEKRADAIRKAKAHNSSLRAGDHPMPVPDNPRHVSPRDWRRRQERDLAKKACAIDARETALVRREEEADSILEIAGAVAAGDLSVMAATNTETNPEGAATDGETPRAKRARTLFGKALARLKRDAERKAQETLAREVETLRKATDILAEITRSLPDAARKRLAGSYTALAKRLAALGPLDRPRGKEAPDRDDTR